MAQVMLGALLQILPVAVGVTVPCPRLTAALIHLPLTLGTLALAGAKSVQPPFEKGKKLRGILRDEIALKFRCVAFLKSTIWPSQNEKRRQMMFRRELKPEFRSRRH